MDWRCSAISEILSFGTPRQRTRRVPHQSQVRSAFPLRQWPGRDQDKRVIGPRCSESLISILRYPAINNFFHPFPETGVELTFLSVVSEKACASQSWPRLEVGPAIPGHDLPRSSRARVTGSLRIASSSDLAEQLALTHFPFHKPSALSACTSLISIGSAICIPQHN